MQHQFWSVEHVQIIPSWCLESQLTTEMAQTEMTTISKLYCDNRIPNIHLWKCC